MRDDKNLGIATVWIALLLLLTVLPLLGTIIWALFR